MLNIPTVLVVGLVANLSLSVTVTCMLVTKTYRDWKTGIDVDLADILIICVAPILGRLLACVVVLSCIDDCIAGKPVVIIRGKKQ